MTARRNDPIDLKARNIAAAAVAGKMPEDAARWELAALVLETGVVGEVTARASLLPSSDQQLVRDVSDRLQRLLERKILSSAPNALSLVPIAKGASISGWARRLAFSAVPSELRNVRQGRSREILSFGESINGPCGPEFARDRSHDPLGRAFNPQALERSEALIDDHRRRARSSTGPEALVREQARTLQHWYDLPPLHELDDEVRAELRSRIRHDPQAVYDGLYRIAAGEELDPVLAAPFKGWPPEALDVVLGLGSRDGVRVASTLAMSAAAARPPRPHRVRKQFRSLVNARSSDPSWRWTANPLAGAYLRTVTDLQSVARGRRLELKPQSLKDIEQSKFATYVSRALTAPGQPVGTTTEEVADTLRDLLADSERVAA